MSERIDFWRGFSGGLLAGVVVGAFIYLSPKNAEETASMNPEMSDGRQVDPLFLHREAKESGGDPSRLVPESTKISKIEHELHKQVVG